MLVWLAIFITAFPCLCASSAAQTSHFEQDTGKDAGLKSQMSQYHHDRPFPQLKFANEPQQSTSSITESGVSSQKLSIPDPEKNSDAVKVSSGRRFSGIFYINRDVDKLRRENMETALSIVNKQETRVVRLRAVDAIEVEQDPEFFKLMPLGCCTNTAAQKCQVAKISYEQGMRSCACDFMHRKAYQRVAEQPDGFYLILEDDIKFTSSDWQQRAMEFIDTAPEDWDMLRIGFWGDSHPDDAVPGHPGWMRAFRDRGKYPEYKGYYGAHAIVLTPARAKRLVEVTSKYYGDFADRFTKDGQDGLHSYVSDKDLVGIASGYGSTRNDGIVKLSVNALQHSTPTSREYMTVLGYDDEVELTVRTLR